MPSSDGQDLLALQKAIHSSNLQSSRQKEWHPEKMTEIQTHVSDIFHFLHPLDRLFLQWTEKLHLTLSITHFSVMWLPFCIILWKSKGRKTGKRKVDYNPYSTYHQLEEHKKSFPFPKAWIQGRTNKTTGVGKGAYEFRMEAIIISVSTFEAAKALVMSFH